MEPAKTKGYDPAVISEAKATLRDHLGFEETDRVALREEIEQRFSVDGNVADVIYDLLWGSDLEKPG